MGSEPVRRTIKQVDSYRITIIKTFLMFRTLNILVSVVRRPQLAYCLHLVMTWFSSISTTTWGHFSTFHEFDLLRDRATVLKGGGSVRPFTIARRGFTGTGKIKR